MIPDFLLPDPAVKINRRNKVKKSAGDDGNGLRWQRYMESKANNTAGPGPQLLN